MFLAPQPRYENTSAPPLRLEPTIHRRVSSWLTHFNWIKVLRFWLLKRIHKNSAKLVSPVKDNANFEIVVELRTRRVNSIRLRESC